jgi:glycosyltransferase involved in cell wall biosynthesis
VPARPERNPPRIVFVGTSMERKGGWRLLELWRRALAGTAELTLVTLETVPPAEGLEVRNDVRPGDGKIETILAEADIFAMPSSIDSFGYAALEAMAASLPVVAVANAALPELVADGETGILVPPGDDEAFAGALMDLARDIEARRELGDAGRRRFMERFDARRTTAALLELIRDAAG